MEKQPSGELMTHIREHIEKWPATKQDIISACNRMGHIDTEERKMFIEMLPEGTYNTPDDVFKAMEEAMKKM